MHNNRPVKRVITLIGILGLIGCNGGNSSTNTNSATTANPLQQYINLLTYTPAQGKQLSGAGSNQQSFSTPGGIQINSVDIKYYSGADCSGTATLATTLNGPSTPAAGTYTSSNASNYALCDKYSGNCAGLYNAVNADPPAVRSIQYIYNLESGTFTTQCLSNANNNPFSSGAFEAILNYSQNPPVACTSGSSCGYSQSYAATSLFTRIYLPQTGQLYCVPGTSFTTTCGDYTSVVGTDGYGRNIPSYGDYIPYGVAWAYNGSGALNPLTRFTTGTQADGAACASGQEVENDNLTGLMWVQNPSTTTYKWQDTTVTPNTYPAQAAIDAMNASGYCGYNDWRLPNVNELASMVNQGESNSATWLNGNGFSNVRASNYWSSTTYATSTSLAWYVNMNGGLVGRYNQTTSYRIWPVRGTTTLPAQIPQTGQTTSYAAGDDGALQKGTVGTTASGRFIAATDPNGTACTSGQEVESDLQTGLMWIKAPSATTYSWADAIAKQPTAGAAIPATYCGYSDWRLPNRNELRSLVNYGQENPATWLNSAGFNNVQEDYYWSSTTYANDTTYAWYIQMYDGFVSNHDKTTTFYVWPVRGGQ